MSNEYLRFKRIDIESNRNFVCAYLSARWGHLSETVGITFDAEVGKMELINESENMLAPCICPSVTVCGREEGP